MAEHSKPELLVALPRWTSRKFIHSEKGHELLRIFAEHEQKGLRERFLTHVDAGRWYEDHVEMLGRWNTIGRNKFYRFSFDGTTINETEWNDHSEQEGYILGYARQSWASVAERKPQLPTNMIPNREMLTYAQLVNEFHITNVDWEKKPEEYGSDVPVVTIDEIFQQQLGFNQQLRCREGVCFGPEAYTTGTRILAEYTNLP